MTAMENQKGTVLIVDDEPATLELLSDLLRRDGFNILTAPNGQCALEQSNNSAPDIILLDVMMPGLDGYETCRRLKSRAETKNVPVIFMTALSDIEDKKEAFAAGAVDFLTKPLNYQEISVRIETHLKTHRLQAQLQQQNIQLNQEIAQRKQMELALQKTQDELEQRVADRTDKLSQANAALLAEISERKQIEAEREKSQTLFRQVVSSISAHIYATEITNDGYWHNLYISPNVTDLTGYPHENFVNDWSFWNSVVIHPDDRVKAAAQVDILQKGQDSETEYRLIRADGETIWIHDSARVETRNGIRVIYGVVNNITSQKAAEDTLRKMEQRYRRLFEEAPAMYAVVRMQADAFIIEDCNQSFAKTLEYEQSEIIGQPLVNFCSSESRQKILKNNYLQETLNFSQECQLLTKDGLVIETLMRITQETESSDPPPVFRIMCLDITERKHAEILLQQQAQQLQILHEIDQSILTAQSLKAIARAVLHNVLQLLPCQQASVILFDFSNSEILIFAVSLNQNTRLGIRRRLPMKAFGPVEDLQKGEIRLVKDILALNHPSHIENLLVQEGIRSLLCVPLIGHGELLGSLNFGNNSPYTSIMEYIGVTRQVANQLSVAIIQSRLFEAEADRRREAEALREATEALNSSLDLDKVLEQILINVGGVVAHDAANIMLIKNQEFAQTIGTWGQVDPKLKDFSVSLIDATHLHQMFTNRQPLILKDTRSNPVLKAQWTWARSYLGVPIILGEEVIGFLNLGSTMPSFFSVHQSEILKAFADQAAVAIRNARLHAQVQTQATNLTTLNKAGQLVTSALDLETVLNLTLQEANSLISAEGTAILLLDPDGDELVFSAVVSPGAEIMMGQRVPLYNSIAGWALLHQECVLIDDVQPDARFYNKIDKTTGLTTQSILAVPLISKQKTLGVFESTNKLSGSFDEGDLELLTALAAFAAIAIENAQLFEQVQAGREHLRDLTRQVVAAQEEERQRLSYELHDEAGQVLTALKIALDLMMYDVPSQAETLKERLNEAITMTDMIMERLRSLARDLRPPALDTTGLNLTLEGVCREFAGWAHMLVNYEGSEVKSLSDTTQITLYRFLQEALTNVAKHASANQVSVKLYSENHYVYLRVEDNGQGFDLQTVQTYQERPKSVGLLGMYERLELVGGNLEIDTAPDVGTCLTARVPMEENQ